MNNPLIAFLLAGGIAFAGNSSKEVIPPAPEPTLWQWFAGGSGGYLTDFEDAMYHVHLGADFRRSESLTHSWFLEAGYAEGLETRVGRAVVGDFVPETAGQVVLEDGLGTFSGELEMVPVTLNYKLEGVIRDRWNWYVGAGAGAAFVDADYRLSVTGEFPPFEERFSDDDTVFAGQVFAGLVWNASDQVELYSGVRYLWFDDPEFSEAATDSVLEVELDDFLVEGGFRYNF